MILFFKNNYSLKKRKQNRKKDLPRDTISHEIWENGSGRVEKMQESQILPQFDCGRRCLIKEI